MTQNFSFCKRTFDLLASSVGLLLLSPFFLFTSLIIWLNDGWPIFFVQTRIGQKGKPFKMLKFRTMVKRAPELGGALTYGKDPRITPVGHWLRKSKLDELPQLLNVFLGQMSLVGPRPEVEKYVRLYTETQKRVLDLKPGITDLASIQFRNEGDLLATQKDPENFYIREIMPEKIKLNLSYAATASVSKDILVILKTIFKF